MSEEQSQEQTPDNSQDVIKNLKEEFNRKLQSQHEELSTLKETNQAILEQLQSVNMSQEAQQTAKQAADEGKSLNDLLYEDPDKYAAKVREQASEEAKKIIAEQEKKIQQKEATQTTLAELASAYPEINYQDHELTKRAVEVYKGFTQKEKADPKSYKLAVYQAANELGIKPSYKRSSEENEAFSLPSGASGSGASRSRKAKKEDKLNDETIQFAKFLGINVDDKKELEQLQNVANNKRFEVWQES